MQYQVHLPTLKQIHWIFLLREKYNENQTKQPSLRAKAVTIRDQGQYDVSSADPANLLDTAQGGKIQLI